MGWVPLTPVSGSFTDRLCGLRQFSLLSLGLVFPEKKIYHSVFLEGAKTSETFAELFKGAQKCISKALI